MVDVDTFPTTLYVRVDDGCKTFVPPASSPGPQAALSRSATVTLVLCGQWQGFGSERGLYRYAPRHWRAACPTRPSREQCNRHVRQQPEDHRLRFWAGAYEGSPPRGDVLCPARPPHPGLASVGAPACGPSGVDQSFEGHTNQQTWWQAYGAQVICPPKRKSRAPWPKRLRRWVAGVRQMVATG